MLQIALIVAIWYAVLDWKYVKAGGQRVTHSEWLAWIISVGTLSLLTIAALDINGGVLILMLAFMVYEARRWRVRRKHPLQGQQQPDHPALNPLEQAPVNRSMKLNVVRGFRRLAWVIVFLCIPVAAFVSYKTSLIPKYSKELISVKYPNIIESQISKGSHRNKNANNKIYTVVAPDGHKVDIQAPADALDDEVIAQAQRLYSPELAALLKEIYPRDNGEYRLPVETIVNILDDERKGKGLWSRAVAASSPPFEQVSINDANEKKRSAIEELRRLGSFPYGWEVETKRLDKMSFAARLFGIMAGIIILLHGSISAAAWVMRGFKHTPV